MAEMIGAAGSRVAESPEPALRSFVPTLDYLGHAGFIYRHRSLSVLIDPWFFPAFAQSWFPLPDNRFLLPAVEDEHFDFLYVSHLHGDHCDTRLLARLAKDTVILCPAFRSRGLERLLADLGFSSIVPLGHLEEINLSDDVRATMIVDTSHKEDSALLLDAAGHRFLDLNDCHPRLSEMPREVDVMAAQFSGAMWYPHCYDFAEEVQTEKVDAVRSHLMGTLVSSCVASDARWLLPSAGPAAFLDPELMSYNDPRSTIFPRWDDVADDFARACPGVGVIRAGPGERLTLEPGAPRIEHAERAGASAPDLADYAARRRSEYDLDRSHRPVTTEEIREHFAGLQRHNRVLVSGFSKRLVVVSDGRSWDVRIGAYPELEVTEHASAEGARYLLRVPGWLLRQVIDGDLGWEDALLSMRIGLHRDPDVFDAQLLGLLRYGGHPAQTRQMLLDGTHSEEMIDRDGLRLQRYCPHAGEDLYNAILDGGVLECPRHHWKWDVDTGKCIEGGDLCLRIGPAPDPGEKGGEVAPLSRTSGR